MDFGPELWLEKCPNVTRWRKRIANLSTPSTNHLGCLDWLGQSSAGYGVFTFTQGSRRRVVGAHRAAWLAYRGPIPAGLVPDHLCLNTRCINPDHLELVTPAENTRRVFDSDRPRVHPTSPAKPLQGAPKQRQPRPLPKVRPYVPRPRPTILPQLPVANESERRSDFAAIVRRFAEDRRTA